MKAPQYQIKNKKFITAEKTNSQGGKDFELKSGTKLSDVFNCLPYGRVNKTETGIGATTLELGSPRDSIVVQPLKVTAEGKSEQPVNGNNIHYYGKITPKSNGTIMTADKTSKLNSYISNSGNRFKKITVVVDNLESLINELGTSAYDYFLMLDEIDSIQKDSTFRSKMEDCIEIYKKFPEKQRSVISATLLDFSDPELSREVFTSIKYDVSPKEPILLNQSSNPIGYAATAILDTLKLIKTNGKDEKLVVAFNGVKRSVEIIDNIKKTDPTVIPDSDISILCGDQEKNNNLIARFNNSGIQNGILPSTLNFTTSAYFTGFDISEAYHLIILSDCRKPYTTISELEMIQIVGRCRLPSPSLLSFNIIHNWNNQPFTINHSKEELIDAAKQEIKSLECINHNYENNLVLREKMLEMRKALIAITGFNNFNFVKETSGELKVSYLNIDAYIEHIRVKRELYNNPDDLYNCFVKLGFSVHKQVKNSKNKVLESESDLKKNNAKELESFQSFLSLLEPDKTDNWEDELEGFRSNLKGNIVPEMCDFVKLAVNEISMNDIRVHLKSINTKNKIGVLTETFKVFISDDEPKRTLIRATFKQSDKFRPDELHEKLKEVLVALNLLSDDEYSEKSGMKYLKRFVYLRQTTSNNGKAYEVMNHNPMGFKLLVTED